MGRSRPTIELRRRRQVEPSRSTYGPAALADPLVHEYGVLLDIEPDSSDAMAAEV